MHLQVQTAEDNTLPWDLYESHVFDGSTGQQIQSKNMMEKNKYFFHMAANRFAKQFCFPDLDFFKQQNAPYTCSHKLQTPLITSAYK